ncbi:MAG: sugar transferase [Clostridia bacterium]|nr:sugar transferase [Clostridia bacterium]
MYQRWGKRLLDVFLSALGITVLCPLFILVAAAVKLDAKGPVFFRQRRMGKDKELFLIWKFRTMRMDTPRDVPTHELKNARSYITPAGRVLRATSVDELPQLFNILRGQMSFIGPRPALWNQTDLIALRDEYGANNVLPGLSGWAQVNGRDELSLEKKSLRDGEYAQNVSFALDVKCILLTLVKVFNREGIAEGREGKHYLARKLEVHK